MRHAPFVSAFLLGASAWAQSPKTSASAPSLDLVHQLERLEAGRPFPIVAVASGGTLVTPRSVPVRKAVALKAALQDIGDAFSSPARPDVPAVLRDEIEKRRTVYIPFLFPKASNLWTIAPDRYWDISTADDRGDILSTSDTRILFDVFCHSLNEDQLSKSGGTGLAWDDYSPDQQRLLKAAFNHPYALYRGSQSAGPGGVYWEDSSETPLPIEQGVLHLYGAYASIFLHTLKQPYDTELFFLQEDGLQLRQASRPDVSYGAFTSVDPKQKPGDLRFEAATLDPPLGVSGISTLKTVIEAAAKQTHLRLAVDARYADRPTFISSPALRTGDVLRVLAFDLQGAWRKVGATYLLTWDHAGAAAVRQQLEDSRPDSTARRTSLAALKKKTAVKDWDTLARKILVPDPSYPVGPTPEQITTLMAPYREGMTEDEVNARAAFTTLDPAQQNAIRSFLKDRKTRGDSDSLNPSSPITEEMLDKGYLFGHYIRPILDLPGKGPINLSRATFVSIDTFTASYDEWDERREANEKAQAAAKPLGPPALTSEVRAVAPPALMPDEWPRIIQQMRRKGLNTLYVPVLWDGQTPFASRYFPELPAAHGKDLLAEVLAMAKKEHITTIGVIHSLAWRFPGGTANHWLTRHPDWIDIDATGRTRLQWLETHPHIETSYDVFSVARDLVAADPLVLSDCVRPTEPAVRERLLGLIGELRGYKDLDGVALDHWSRLSGHGYNTFWSDKREAAPPLGFSMADRIAYLGAQSIDPIDLNDQMSSIYVPGPEALAPTGETDYDKPLKPWNAYRFAQDAVLANSLVAEMEKGWPGQVQVFSYVKDLDEGKAPEGDVTVRVNGAAKADKVYYAEVPAPDLVVETPKPPRSDEEPAPIQSSADPAKRLEAFRTGLATAATGKPPQGIVLNFTGSPDLLWDGLALLDSANASTATKDATPPKPQ